MMKKLLVANWKMNKNGKEAMEFLHAFKPKYSGKRDAWIASQALYIKLLINENVKAGLQNCSEHVSGAYTGEVSPRNFKEMGGTFVITGHSERRQYFNETSRSLNAKNRTVIAEGLTAIYCVGETLAEREANLTLSLIADQLHQGLNDLSMANADNLVIAYEPVWAIGTGKTASPAQAQEVHAFIRETLKNKFPAFGDKVRILYGGSVKPDNVEELLSQKDIDGGLVGGASLKPKDFLALCGDF
jgi:triosephosphate isomerase (TIM)